MHAAIDEGITFFDNAWDYHDGGCEELMGKALADGRQAREGLPDDQELRPRRRRARCKHLEDSLRRLQTDVIDLWQFHEIDLRQRPRLDRSRRAACKAALEAKKEGKVRFIGFTGHKDPRIHLKMLGKPLAGTRCRCRSTCWTRTTAASRSRWCRCACGSNVGVIGMKGFGGGHAGIVGRRGPHRGGGVPLRAQPARRVAGRRHHVAWST